MNGAMQLQVRGLHKRFGRRTILAGVDLGLPRGSCTLLTGENGAGKSTLMRILSGMERVDDGRFRIGEGPLLPWRRARRDLTRRIMYLHQQPYMFDGSVEYNLHYPLKRIGLNRAERNRRVDQALEWIAMENLRHSQAPTLSGGERQRVALARAWLGSPTVLLLDEPTANLDGDARHWTLELLQRLCREGMTLLVASHDPTHFSPLAGHCLHLQEGRLEVHPLSSPRFPYPAKVIPIRRDYA
jgi:ABC-type multidrug transport system, ATPase component